MKFSFSFFCVIKTEFVWLIVLVSLHKKKCNLKSLSSILNSDLKSNKRDKFSFHGNAALGIPSTGSG